jgi:hypothetical protein
VALSTSDAGYWGDQALIDMEANVRAGNVTVEQAQASPERLAAEGEKLFIADTDLGECAANTSDGWMNLQQGMTRYLLTALADQAGAPQTSIAREVTVSTVAHELEHARSGVQGAYAKLSDLEEGTADYLSHLPGVQAKLAGQLGIKLDAPEAPANGTYADQATVVAQLVSAAGATTPDQARALLHGTPLADEPAAIASAIAAAHKLPPATAAKLTALVARAPGDGAAFAQIGAMLR